MSITDKLHKLKTTKESIKNAIITKGVEVLPDDKFVDYGDKIRQISSEINPIEQLNNDFARIGYDQSDIPFNLLNSAEYDTKLQNDIAYSKAKFNEWNPNATQPYRKYAYDQRLVYAPKVDTRNAIMFGELFARCPNLIYVPPLDMSNPNAYQVVSMFWECTSLEYAPMFDTKNITHFNGMFQLCYNLKYVPLYNTEKAISLNSMFYKCANLKYSPSFNTKNVKDFSVLFGKCESLEYVPLLDMSSATNVSKMFLNCINLTHLGGFKGLKINLSLSESSKLTHESLMNVINNLADLSPTVGTTITIGSANIKKLTDAEIKIATDKGWTIGGW